MKLLTAVEMHNNLQILTSYFKKKFRRKSSEPS